MCIKVFTKKQKRIPLSFLTVNHAKEYTRKDYGTLERKEKKKKNGGQNAHFTRKHKKNIYIYIKWRAFNRPINTLAPDMSKRQCSSST